MKFGEYLSQNIEDRWRNFYLDYDQLKKLIKALSFAQLQGPGDDHNTSLSFGYGAEASYKQPHSGDQAFVDFLEAEMKKVRVKLAEGDADKYSCRSTSSQSAS